MHWPDQDSDHVCTGKAADQFLNDRRSRLAEVHGTHVSLHQAAVSAVRDEGVVGIGKAQLTALR